MAESDFEAEFDYDFFLTAMVTYEGVRMTKHEAAERRFEKEAEEARMQALKESARTKKKNQVNRQQKFIKKKNYNSHMSEEKKAQQRARCWEHAATK